MKIHSPLMFSLSLTCFFTFSATAQQNITNYYFVSYEYRVSPDNYDTFVEWSKAFKKVADEKKAANYFAEYSDGSFKFIYAVGTEKSGIETFQKEWDAWIKANPEIEKLYDKYAHSTKSVMAYYWKSDSDLFYRPTNYNYEEKLPYIRYGERYIKPGKEEEAILVIKEYVAEYEKQKVPFPVYVYWNIMGKEQPMLLIMTKWKDPEDWGATTKMLEEKLKDNQKIQELGKRFRATLRDSKDYEAYRRPELSHHNED